MKVFHIVTLIILLLFVKRHFQFIYLKLLFILFFCFKQTFNNLNEFFKVIIPETVDVYEGRNSQTIFCLYALAIRLFRLRKAPPIRNKTGVVQFTGEKKKRKEIIKKIKFFID